MKEKEHISFAIKQEEKVDSYIDDFQKFLFHTDEKEILFGEIYKEIEKYNIHSLLDIGVGDGLLSIPLSKKVRRYLAIESKEEYVKNIQEAGLEVVQGKFPIKINESFDSVLSSHSLGSYRKENLESFVRGAWKLVNLKGILLIITYRGEKDDWTNLMDYIGARDERFDIKIVDYNKIGYDTLIKLLNSLGEVKIRKVITKVVTDNIEDMIQALCFVFSYGKTEKREQFLSLCTKLENILNSQYRDGMRYYFPFQHFFIVTQKTCCIS